MHPYLSSFKHTVLLNELVYIDAAVQHDLIAFSFSIFFISFEELVKWKRFTQPRRKLTFFFFFIIVYLQLMMRHVGTIHVISNNHGLYNDNELSILIVVN